MDAFTTHVQIIDGGISSINVGIGLYDIKFKDNGEVVIRKYISTRNGGTTWRLMKKAPADYLAAAEMAARQSALNA